MKVYYLNITMGLVLFAYACSGPEAFLGFKYAVENWIAPEMSSLSEVVVPTDDPFQPDKTLYLGETSQRETEQKLRHPDLHVTSTAGYSYWDYCYTEHYKVSKNPTPQQTKNCNALRLFFDDRNLLYDHGHVVISNRANSKMSQRNGL